MKKIPEQTENLLKLRNYSPKTRKTYLLYIKQYLIFSKKHTLKKQDSIMAKNQYTGVSTSSEVSVSGSIHIFNE